MGPKKKADPNEGDDAEKVSFLTNKVNALKLQIIW
jgi:hypothetical protein